MKVVIPGGSGQVGKVLRRALLQMGHQVLVLCRNSSSDACLAWDGKSLGPWADAFEGADVVINLAGRSVNCRYTKSNLKEMMDSRVDSTRVVGEAISQAKNPPKLWLQASTATIYAHTFGDAHDEANGVIGGSEKDVPGYWSYSIDIAKAWEGELEKASTPHTRKVALRSAMIMSPDRGGIFDTLLTMARFGIGGSVAGGQQFVSWIHEEDFVAAIELVINDESLSGVVNICAPSPLIQRDFMEDLRSACGVGIGLPATKWMVEIGAFFLRTDTELILKSRRVVPGKLLESGFKFKFPTWDIASRDLVKRWKELKQARKS